MKDLVIYSYRDYRTFLEDQISSFPNHGRGVRARLAETMRCQLPFVTHVLAGRNHLSPEQAEAAARFFGLSAEESEYFLLLVSFNRAGTPELKVFLEKLLKEKAERNQLLKKKLKIPDTLKPEDQMRYYSHWVYAATHMALTIPELRTRTALCERLRVPVELMNEVLVFLVNRGFARKEGLIYKPLRAMLHLENRAPTLINHHTNWRHRAIESLVYERESDMHYSGVMSCSKKDILRIREKMAQVLAECVEVVKPSPEEDLVGLCIDIFGI